MPSHRPSSAPPSTPASAQRRLWLHGLCTATLGLMVAGCASSPPSRSARWPSRGPAAGSAEATALRQDIALFALSLLDMPYSAGGRGPATGFDCSGLVSHVYLQAAKIQLTGSAAAMAQALHKVDLSIVQAGDLLFFNTLGPAFSHVGIFVGDGRFVHASNPRTGVRMDRIGHRYYASRYEAARSWFS